MTTPPDEIKYQFDDPADIEDLRALTIADQIRRAVETAVIAGGAELEERLKKKLPHREGADRKPTPENRPKPQKLKAGDLVQVLTGCIWSRLHTLFHQSQLVQPLDSTNPLAELSHMRKVTRRGPGGVSSERATPAARDLHDSQRGRLCPYETPESEHIGLNLHLAREAKVSSEQITPSAPDPQQPETALGWAASSVPFLAHDDAARALMGAKNMKQAVPLLNPEKPLVATGVEGPIAEHAGGWIRLIEKEKVSAEWAACVVRSPLNGKVMDKTPRSVTVEVEGTAIEQRYEFESLYPTMAGTPAGLEPKVEVGQDVVADKTILAAHPATCDGRLALGCNLLVAYMPYHGLNFEDGIVASKRLVDESVLTSRHLKRVSIELHRDEMLVRDRVEPDGQPRPATLNEFGVVKLGAEVVAGDELARVYVRHTRWVKNPPKDVPTISFDGNRYSYRRRIEQAHPGETGKVARIVYLPDEERPSAVEIWLESQRPLRVGDKLMGRHGNKGVVTAILDEGEMPWIPVLKRAADLVLNPVGVLNRKNLGQLIETHVGLVAKEQPELLPMDGFPACQTVSREELRGWLAATSVGETGKTQVQVPIELGTDRGKAQTPLPVTVGYQYFFKLNHLADDKVSFRGVGPLWGNVTAQPVKGRRAWGGQRWGEMEAWALKAWNVPSVLDELITTKSDDLSARDALAKFLESGLGESDVALDHAHLPESVSILRNLLGGLGVAVRFFSDKLQRRNAMRRRERERDGQKTEQDESVHGHDEIDIWNMDSPPASDDICHIELAVPGERGVLPLIAAQGDLQTTNLVHGQLPLPIVSNAGMFKEVQWVELPCGCKGPFTAVIEKVRSVEANAEIERCRDHWTPLAAPVTESSSVDAGKKKRSKGGKKTVRTVFIPIEGGLYDPRIWGAEGDLSWETDFGLIELPDGVEHPVTGDKVRYLPVEPPSFRITDAAREGKPSEWGPDKMYAEVLAAVEKLGKLGSGSESQEAREARECIRNGLRDTPASLLFELSDPGNKGTDSSSIRPDAAGRLVLPLVRGIATYESTEFVELACGCKGRLGDVVDTSKKVLGELKSTEDQTLSGQEKDSEKQQRASHQLKSPAEGEEETASEKPKAPEEKESTKEWRCRIHPSQKCQPVTRTEAMAPVPGGLYATEIWGEPENEHAWKHRFGLIDLGEEIPSPLTGMRMRYLPVLPPHLRFSPHATRQGKRPKDSMDDRYSRVWAAAEALRQARLGNEDTEQIDALRKILVNAVKGTLEYGLLPLVAGKKGFLRQRMLGKRVEFSGRAVIVCDPQLDVDECGIPLDVAVTAAHSDVLPQLRAAVDAGIPSADTLAAGLQSQARARASLAALTQWATDHGVDVGLFAQSLRCAQMELPEKLEKVLASKAPRIAQHLSRALPDPDRIAAELLRAATRPGTPVNVNDWLRAEKVHPDAFWRAFGADPSSSDSTNETIAGWVASLCQSFLDRRTERIARAREQATRDKAAIEQLESERSNLDTAAWEAWLDKWIKQWLAEHKVETAQLAERWKIPIGALVHQAGQMQPRTLIGKLRELQSTLEFAEERGKETLQRDPGTVVLLNRAPSLHRYSVQAFRPVVRHDSVIGINPLVCGAFNADFDGDTMALHLTVRAQAVSEAWQRMRPSKNLRSVAAGQPLVSITHEMLAGLAAFNRNQQAWFGRAFGFTASIDEKKGVLVADDTQAALSDRIRQWAVNAPAENGPGKEADETDSPARTAMRRGFCWATLLGLSVSFLDIPEHMPPSGSSPEGPMSSPLVKWIEAVASRDPDSGVSLLMRSGAVRDPDKLVGQLSGECGAFDKIGDGKTPHVTHNLTHGLSIDEMIWSCYGARKSLGDKKLTTPVAGDLTRRLAWATERCCVVEEDCGTKNGIAVLDLVEVGKVHNTLLSKADWSKGRWTTDGKPVESVAVDSDELRIRSPLTCDLQPDGKVCARCYGTDPSTGKLVEVGTMVGFLAAQSIGERGTQLAMNTFHSGGVSGHDVNQGLPRVIAILEGWRVAVPGRRTFNAWTSLAETGEARESVGGKKIRRRLSQLVSYDVEGLIRILVYEMYGSYKVKDINPKHFEVVLAAMIERLAGEPAAPDSKPDSEVAEQSNAPKDSPPVPIKLFGLAAAPKRWLNPLKGIAYRDAKWWLKELTTKGAIYDVRRPPLDRMFRAEVQRSTKSTGLNNAWYSGISRAGRKTKPGRPARHRP